MVRGRVEIYGERSEGLSPPDVDSFRDGLDLLHYKLGPPVPKTVQLLALMADSHSPAALIGRPVECRPLLLQNLRVWTTTLVAPTFSASTGWRQS